MFTTHPPIPSPEAIRELRLDADALHLLVKLRADMVAAIRVLEPETLLAVASQHFPGEGNYQTAAKFGLEVMAALRALAQHGEDVRSVTKAETERLAPMVFEAGRRVLEIPSKLDGIAYQLRGMDSSIDERRDSLRKAGAKDHEIERLIADGEEDREARRADLSAQRTALLAEQEALGKFLKSGNERDLPEGFRIVVVPRISGRDAHLMSVAAEVARIA